MLIKKETYTICNAMNPSHPSFDLQVSKKEDNFLKKKKKIMADKIQPLMTLLNEAKPSSKKPQQQPFHQQQIINQKNLARYNMEYTQGQLMN